MQMRLDAGMLAATAIALVLFEDEKVRASVGSETGENCSR